ncbi:LacI family DNA-binding transcriptional regulator [Luteimonas deserti]|uniref:LacI family DNA-binding transcriptional regulator n=1 Tax=Luteimonas deserti TaxID=2752306 RepID=A0A7Z0TZ48_9GAMM|nr:LacI family DNA-binding transcriptional regulator [Luteimonas deserti]NYZ63067.1 LacI family DNA-binding transcriptional regulator [Luteimonas deserti]
MGVTIKDVAKAASVSVATVSRALNGHQNVAEAVRQRVLDAASALRYSPHHAARSLSSRRTQTVGVVLPDLHGEFFSELMRGIDQVARAHGLHLLVSSYHGNPVEQGAALRAMRGRVDGLLLLSPYVHDADFLTSNVDDSLPLVLMNSAGPVERPSIGIDNYTGARAMVRHLVALGHRRIAFIGGPVDNDDARERLRGYRDALDAADPALALWELPGEFDEASGHRAGQALLSMDERPDAVFAANDTMAIGCIYALRRGGVRTPDDIAVVGFDDIPLARYVHPSLTTMRVDIAELGARALRALLDPPATGTQMPVPSKGLQPVLVVRESCGGGGMRTPAD